jgi:hypothetical protein
MSPVFRRESEYTFKIYSNEEERMHIHVICGGHEAKYWLEPRVELAKNSGIGAASRPFRGYRKKTATMDGL